MKKMLALLAGLLFCSGCAINLPLTGKLDEPTAANLKSGGLKKIPLAYYVDPDTRGRQLERYTDGSYAGARAVIIPIGQALSNALYEGLKNSYEDVRWVERPDPLPGYYLLKVRAEQLDAGFEFSAVTAAYLHKMAPELLLDKARVSVTLQVEAIPPDPSRKPFKEVYRFEEKDTEREVPPPSQAGIMEKVLNRIAFQFANKIKTAVPGAL
jgi:hypothetical protein